MTRTTPAEQRAILDLLEEALELPEVEREGYIASHAASEAVREGALMLLAQHEGSAAALRTGLPGALGGFDEDYEPPERLGPYRILRPIGRGGMGMVYLGERDAGDFERQVAIKIIRPGMLSDDLVARFTRERQILATLDHPHIARMYDGGQTAEGAPFLVMEYVAGQPLGEWVESAQPDLDRRLARFREVLDAVACAHRNLVIHRDLTPANILVTEEGGVKLIDFGISRPLEQGDGDHIAPERRATATPGYSAPEAGGAATTLGDIYSLGRLLAELARPYAEPELTAIATKASAADPAARYPTVEAMAQELEAWQGGFPVAAFATDRAYRLRKFVIRKKTGVALGALAAVVMVAGVVALEMAYRDEMAARQEAEQRFGEVRELANFMLFDLYDELEDVPGATAALNSMADRSRLYLDALSASEGADDEVRLEAALAYKRLSDVLGTPIAANLGRREEAEETLNLALAQLRALRQRAPGSEAVNAGLAEALYSQAVFAYIALDDNELAHAAAQESADLFWQLAERHGSEDYAVKALDAEVEAALPLAWVGRGDEGVEMLEGTLSRVRSHIARYGETPANLGMLARTQSNLSETMGRFVEAEYGAQADYRETLRHADDAIASYRRYVAESERKDGPRRSMAVALFKRSLITYSMGRYDRALADLDEAEDIIAAQIALDPADSGLERTLGALHEQKAITLAYAGRGAEGLVLARRSLAADRAALEKEPDNPGLLREYASLQLIVAEVAEIAGREAEACQIYREADSIYRRIEAGHGLSEYDREFVMGDLAPAIERLC